VTFAEIVLRAHEKRAPFFYPFYGFLKKGAFLMSCSNSEEGNTCPCLQIFDEF